MERDGSSSHYGHSSFNSKNTSSDNKDNSQTLPISSILRLMKQIVPQNTKISNEAKEIIRICVVEFIGFVTNEADEHCQREQKRIIASEDLKWAMSSLGFNNYAELLNDYQQQIQDNNAAVIERMIGLPSLPPRRRVVEQGSLSCEGLCQASWSGVGGGASSGGDGEEAEFDPSCFPRS